MQLTVVCTLHADCKLQEKCFLSVGASESSEAYTKVRCFRFQPSATGNLSPVAGAHLRTSSDWSMLSRHQERPPMCMWFRFLQVQRKLVIACVLCFIFMLVEVVGGYIAKRYAVEAQPEGCHIHTTGHSSAACDSSHTMDWGCMSLEGPHHLVGGHLKNLCYTHVAVCLP